MQPKNQTTLKKLYEDEFKEERLKQDINDSPTIRKLVLGDSNPPTHHD
jgi:hypothetical protein